MPPRGAKKGTAKKATPKSKAEPVTVTPSSTAVAVQEPPPVKPVSPVPIQSLEVEETKKEDVVVVEEVVPEVDKEEDVKVEEVVKTEVVSTTTTTNVVVEETNTVEEIVEEIVEEKVEVVGGDVEMGDEEEEPEEIEGEEEVGEEEEDAGQDVDGEGEENATENTVVPDEGNANAAAEEGDNKEGDAYSSESDDEDDEDPSAYMQLALTDRKKQKDIEIFVGGLDRKAVEEDLTKVFEQFGEIKSLRIVKHPVTHKSKGFAFLRYANIDQTKKVLTELKDGIEVKGKRVGISASQDSDTIYVGNICKTWTREQVLEALKSFGIEQIEEMYLPDDHNNEGKIRGFALLEFSTHSDAITAFQRLSKKDAVLGRDRSAKVAFAQSMHPSEEALAQVKTVFVEGLTDTWDEEKLKEFCKQYGEVEKIQLSRNLVRTKRKDFGFVTFTSRESALACVEGINNAQLAEGDIKVKANLARPEYKGRLGKSTRGGFRLPKDGERKQEAGSSKRKGNARSRGAEAKEKAASKSKSGKGKNESRSQSANAPPKSDRNNNRRDRPARGKKRDGRSIEASNSGRPSKKPRGNGRGRPSGGFGNRARNSRPGNPRPSYGIAQTVYAEPYRHGYATPGSSYQGHAYGAVPGSSRTYSDLEPHGGYVRPSTRKPGRDVYGYGPRSSGGYSAHGSGPAYGTGAPPPPPPAYGSSYSSYPGYSGGGYVYPSSGAYPSRQGYY